VKRNPGFSTHCNLKQLEASFVGIQSKTPALHVRKLREEEEPKS